jgi:hypothetical protein
MKRFSVHFNLHIPIQIVFFKNFENCRSPFKNETLHQESSKDRKKTLESCDVQNIDNQVKAVNGAHEEIQKQMANNSLKIPIRICSMVTHFQLPTYEYH